MPGSPSSAGARRVGGKRNRDRRVSRLVAPFSGLRARANAKGGLSSLHDARDTGAVRKSHLLS